MNFAKKERTTLSFSSSNMGGSVEETFYPWDLTLERFIQDGFPKEVASRALFDKKPKDQSLKEQQKLYFPVFGAKDVLSFEKELSFDPVMRLGFYLPFTRSLSPDISCHIRGWSDWEHLKKLGQKQRALLFDEKTLWEVYEPFVAGHERGDYSIRMNIEGFFWVPRELIGVEEHLYTFYDEPKLIHDICQEMLTYYLRELLTIVTILKPDVLYIQEDLSGKNGPMISPEFFREFVGAYYAKLIPNLRKHGVGYVFVDTDGDFNALIPSFLEAGIDGFIPMDVNAGMDIVAVRKRYPTLRFIGGYNKLCIAKGPEAIEKEFERILPVIKQGGYIPGSDHQVPPSASLSNYQYYIKRLHEIMEHIR